MSCFSDFQTDDVQSSLVISNSGNVASLAPPWAWIYFRQKPSNLQTKNRGTNHGKCGLIENQTEEDLEEEEDVTQNVTSNLYCAYMNCTGEHSLTEEMIALRTQRTPFSGLLKAK
ncbi:uncharacterized protein ACNLHF_003750 isoform 1-T1 [Anomaloglossus baeobatrachus]